MIPYPKPPPDASGLRLIPGFLDRAEQEELVAALRDIVRRAPLFTPLMPGTGKPFSVRMTNCGPLGWVSDTEGYRYQHAHPVTGEPWPPMPELLARAWSTLSDYPGRPQACLVNYYAWGCIRTATRRTSRRRSYPCRWARPAGSASAARRGAEATRSFLLASGDVLVMAGASRLAFHGVDRILPGTSTLLPDGGRINLTLRRVSRPANRQPLPPCRITAP
jgi:alkylated DNA repair protein (DNA oxidative demethylase)